MICCWEQLIEYSVPQLPCYPDHDNKYPNAELSSRSTINYQLIFQDGLEKFRLRLLS